MSISQVPVKITNLEKFKTPFLLEEFPCEWLTFFEFQKTVDFIEHLIFYISNKSIIQA
jgi:hypothetical protein